MSLLQETINKIVPSDQGFRYKAKERLDRLTMPHWALGRLMDLAMDLAAITRSMKPPLDKRVVVVMAGDHGVVSEGVSKYPQEVTVQMVANFVNGGAGINAIAKTVDAGVVVVDMGVAGDLDELSKEGLVVGKKIGPGTMNMAVGPAMTPEDAVRALEAGIEVALDLGPSVELFGIGEMGIGNTTPSSAIVAALSGRKPEEVTGRGTGLDDEQFLHKVSVIKKCLEVNAPDPADALDVLAKVGGFEIGGIAGLILGAASMNKPVLIDGFISTAGALIAAGLAPECKEFMIAAHRSVEQGHQAALRILEKKPLMDLDLRLGEGTGAALAMSLVESAARVLSEVATFEEAAVSEADK